MKQNMSQAKKKPYLLDFGKEDYHNSWYKSI